MSIQIDLLCEHLRGCGCDLLFITVSNEVYEPCNEQRATLQNIDYWCSIKKYKIFTIHFIYISGVKLSFFNITYRAGGLEHSVYIALGLCIRVYYLYL